MSEQLGGARKLLEEIKGRLVEAEAALQRDLSQYHEDYVKRCVERERRFSNETAQLQRWYQFLSRDLETEEKYKLLLMEPSKK